MTHRISSSNFTYSATTKPRAAAENIGIKMSVLPPTQLFFYSSSATNSTENLTKCVAVLNIVQKEVIYFILSPQYFILFYFNNIYLIITIMQSPFIVKKPCTKPLPFLDLQRIRGCKLRTDP